ncbi:glycoside hydrolase family 3 C-terminal domain-containing protein [Aerococcaceae bacterium zg-ZJ1578]|uniref:glycoside hydrolase family 3 C-terminal domain-containing protein n=1 Tax=Aerococcaceae bacterium zg-252 TaxID=2796928 RepID=UPI001A214EAB|nr:glycoside hydrolase family 3 C-terminal domain-containing protein [Aerococcaceae bacterium zg-1578]
MNSVKDIIEKLTLEEKAALVSGKDFWSTQPIERLGIPSVMMCDGPHGLRKQVGEGDHLGINESIKAVCFPTASALASSFDRELLSRLGENLSKICQAEDVAMLLGPGVNIKRSPLCGRNFEYFSEDPFVTSELAASDVKTLQKNGVSACVKHFAANNQESYRMSGNSIVDERTLREIYFPGFEAVIKKGKAHSIMCAYNQLNGVFAAENKELLKDILRKEWGFNGFVVTDWGAVKDRVKGLLAGLDLEMPGGNSENAKIIIDAVRNNELPIEVLDEAVKNILTFVKRSRKKLVDTTYDLDFLHDEAVDMARECAVLLQNDDMILPLNREQKVAFIGAFAENPRYQGSGSSHINSYKVESALSFATNVHYSKGFSDNQEESLRLRNEAVEAAKSVDVAVLFIGLTDEDETEGLDREHMKLPQNQLDLIDAIVQVQSNVVVILHGGSPVEMPFRKNVKAILNVYLSGEGVGEASVDLLYGNANPSGKLAETYPERLEDNSSYLNFPGQKGHVEYREGVFVGYRYYDKKEMAVAFPFGHGLSYTTFEYSNLLISKKELTDKEELNISVDITNTGKHFGKEVIQLYIASDTNGVNRPRKELKGFEKVALNSGETKTITFTLDNRAFAYYETRIHDWFVETGCYHILIGASSRDIRLEDDVMITGVQEIPIYYTKNSTISDLYETSKGRQVLEQLIPKPDAKQQESNQATADAMGGGASKMLKAMMMEMPLQSLVNFGQMSNADLQALLEGLNS